MEVLNTWFNKMQSRGFCHWAESTGFYEAFL